MLKLIKHTIITLGIASGMTAIALTYQHTPDNCRALVLKEVAKNQQFVDAVATPDFLTAMTKGK
jgi:hypothetical protein